MKIILFFLFSILFSCTNKNISHKLIENINNEIEKKAQINHGEIIARYDLIGSSNKKCLYLKNYSNIINNDSDNKAFIRTILSKIKKEHLIKRRAQDKTTYLKKKLSFLNDKYKIFNSCEGSNFYEEEDIDIFNKIDTDLKISLNTLRKLDKLTSNIPIFFPHSHSKLTSPFGIRKHPITKERKFHCGTDFAGSQPSMPIYASANGRVLDTGKMNGYGNVITISHGNNFKTRYAHLNKILVNKGQHVLKGQKIGIEGNSGNSTSPHLHFEVIFKDKTINPYDFVDNGYECQK